ncbi:unknown [Bacteroides sp. CAG:1060]|nr:unknown [Bacteroides sp. CAG:1060]
MISKNSRVGGIVINKDWMIQPTFRNTYKSVIPRAYPIFPFMSRSIDDTLSFKAPDVFSSE